MFLRHACLEDVFKTSWRLPNVCWVVTSILQEILSTQYFFKRIQLKKLDFIPALSTISISLEWSWFERKKFQKDVTLVKNKVTIFK